MRGTLPAERLTGDATRFSAGPPVPIGTDEASWLA
jgi:hypothetical protein